MSSENLSQAEIIMKGVLGSQILSVPFSCSLSAIVVVLAGRFISKTSPKSDRYRKSFFQFSAGKSQPTRLIMARWAAALVALICVAMTAMELTIVYQSAIEHAGDLEYLMRTPWTSSLVPLLTALVSIATQTYFSDRTCRAVQCPMIFVPLLALLGLGSLISGAVATASLFAAGLRNEGDDINSSEAAFWAYLVFSTLSSLVIMIPLLASYFRDAKVARIEASRTANSKKGPRRMTLFLRLFLSTYTLVFIFDFMCLVTSILSSAPHFQTALQASEAFLVLQKLMVRVMAISYLYTMLDGIPKNPGFNSTSQTANGSADYPFGSDMHKRFSVGGGQGPDAKFDSQNLTAFENYSISNKHPKFTSGDGDEAEEIFAYTYPPNPTSPIASDTRQLGLPPNPTPISAAFNNYHGNSHRAQDSKHHMMDVELRAVSPYSEPEQLPKLAGYSTSPLSLTPEVPMKPKKPMAFSPRRNLPSPPAFSEYPRTSSQSTTTSLLKVTHHLPHPAGSNVSPFSDTNEMKPKPPTQKKPNLVNRRISNMKYVTGGSSSDSLLSFSSDHANQETSTHRPVNVTPQKKVPQHNASGHYKNVASDEEDGEISSVAIMGGQA